MTHNEIRQFREDAGLTQIELARRLGVCQSTLSQYEKGLRDVPRTVRSKMADIFGRDPLPDEADISGGLDIDIHVNNVSDIPAALKRFAELRPSLPGDDIRLRIVVGQ